MTITLQQLLYDGRKLSINNEPIPSFDILNVATTRIIILCRTNDFDGIAGVTGTVKVPSSEGDLIISQFQVFNNEYTLIEVPTPSLPYNITIDVPGFVSDLILKIWKAPNAATETMNLTATLPIKIEDSVVSLDVNNLRLALADAVYKSDSVPSSPSNGFLWYETNSSGNIIEAWEWNSTLNLWLARREEKEICQFQNTTSTTFNRHCIVPEKRLLLSLQIGYWITSTSVNAATNFYEFFLQKHTSTTFTTGTVLGSKASSQNEAYAAWRLKTIQLNNEILDNASTPIINFCIRKTEVTASLGDTSGSFALIYRKIKT